SWRVLYKDGAEWKPVETGGSYGVEKDRYNRVTFKAVTTSGLRLEVAMQPQWSTGLEQWRGKSGGTFLGGRRWLSARWPRRPSMRRRSPRSRRWFGRRLESAGRPGSGKLRGRREPEALRS